MESVPRWNDGFLIGKFSLSRQNAFFMGKRRVFPLRKNKKISTQLSMQTFLPLKKKHFHVFFNIMTRGLQHVILCEDFCIILEKKVSQKMGNLLNFWLVVLLLVTGWMLALDKTKNLVNCWFFCWFFFLNYCKKCVFYLIISLFLKLLQSPSV